MRLDLFLCGYAHYAVKEEDFTSAISTIEHLGVHPKGLKRENKTGSITFFLNLREHKCLGQRNGMKGHGLHCRKTGGIPILCKRWASSPGLVVGALLALLLLVFSRSVLWDVRISGNESLDTQDLERQLSQVGLSPGRFLRGMDTDALALSLRQSEDRVAYAAINLEGTVAFVQIKEAEPTPTTPSKKPANLVAKCDGVITMPLIFEGKCLVEEGQVVRAGEILASGVIDTQNHGYRITRAAGQVMARTVQTYEIKVPLCYEEKCYTGREKHEISLLFFSRAQKVFKNTGKIINNCDIIEKTKWMTLPSGERLPFGYAAITYSEFETVTASRTVAQARALAQAQLRDLLVSESAEATLLQRHVEYAADSSGVTLICTVVWEKDIASVAEIR